jgi:hypothetical protein
MSASKSSFATVDDGPEPDRGAGGGSGNDAAGMAVADERPWPCMRPGGGGRAELAALPTGGSAELAAPPSGPPSPGGGRP